MANVSLILLDDVEHLGLAGEEVRVAAGYARNYLIPKKLAAKATPGTLRLIESRKAAIAARRAAELAAAKELAEKLRNAFASWIDNGHNNFADENTIILCIQLEKGVLFSKGTRYEIDFIN